MTTNDTKGCMECSSLCSGGMASRASERMAATASSCSPVSVATPLGGRWRKCIRWEAARLT